jgi:hypothetical protein
LESWYGVRVAAVEWVVGRVIILILVLLRMIPTWGGQLLKGFDENGEVFIR